MPDQQHGMLFLVNWDL